MNLPGYPEALAARFAPKKLLASGGYGHVFLAEQVTLKRAVALKVLSAGALAEPDQLLRFEAEARVTASLSHPNIVVVIEYGVTGDVPWIAYELLPGRSLRDALAGGPLAPAAAVHAAIQVAAALEHAHAAGVIHRDIKTDNVLEVEAHRFKVADFGIARWAGSTVRTDTGVILGTPLYVAPELITGGAPSPASDTYALGILIYELLTGHTPFQDENPIKLLNAHLRSEPPPLAGQVSGLVPQLERVVMSALAKAPVERPGVAEFRAALESLLPRLAQAGDRLPLLSAGTVPLRARESAKTAPVSKGSLRTQVVAAPPLASRRLHGLALSAAALIALIALAALGVGLAMRVPSPRASPSPSLASADASPAPIASTLAQAISSPGTAQPRDVALVTQVESDREWVQAQHHTMTDEYAKLADGKLRALAPKLPLLFGNDLREASWVVGELCWVSADCGLFNGNAEWTFEEKRASLKLLVSALNAAVPQLLDDPLDPPEYRVVRVADVAGRLCGKSMFDLDEAAVKAHRSRTFRWAGTSPPTWFTLVLAAARAGALDGDAAAIDKLADALKVFADRYFEHQAYRPNNNIVGAWYRLLKLARDRQTALKKHARALEIRALVLKWAEPCRRWAGTHQPGRPECNECTSRTQTESVFAAIEPETWVPPSPWPHLR